MKIENFKSKIVLLVFIIVGAILRFYNLDWGSPFYFHPDERNIASSVSQLTFPDQMNPHFFAYGSLPIYAIYFTGLISNFLLTFNFPLSTHVTFEQAILVSRFFSALFSVLLIPLLFIIGKTLYRHSRADEGARLFDRGRKAHPESLSLNKEHQKRFWTSQNDGVAGLFAAFLAATSVGFIQFAHFGTFEMWLTFFGVLLFWLCLKKITENTVIIMAIIFGVLVATKVSSLALLPLPIIAIIINLLQNHKSKQKQVISVKAGIKERYGPRIKSGMTIVKHIILLLIVSASIYAISNPYVFRDTIAFQSSMKYESSVALGTLPVFYTGEFYDTIPGLFHFLYVYPFLLNPLIALLFVPACIYILYRGFRTKNVFYLLLVTFCLLLFFSQIFLFVKWTRYMLPTLPFLYLIIAIAFTHVIQPEKTHERKGAHNILHFCTFALLHISMITCTIFSISYFITAFIRPDTRTEAKQFAIEQLPSNAKILSEVYDLGIIPFNGSFQTIDLFNFYDLDPAFPTSSRLGGQNPGNPALSAELQIKLQNADYIILPSQRLFKIRLNNPEQFPHGYSFYNSLITDKLGYEKIYETPCDLFCKITYLGDPVFRYEETANVFDRPTVFIFKKK